MDFDMIFLTLVLLCISKPLSDPMIQVNLKIQLSELVVSTHLNKIVKADHFSG